MPYRRTWQSGAAVRSLRPSRDRIPILPQSPLPKVPQPDARRVASRSSDGDSAGSVLSRGLHAPSRIGASGTPNPRVVYGILFRAVAESLLEMAADPKRLGARIGFLAVLHTWSQRREVHPHIHCVVPAGGLSPDGPRWIRPRKKKFFLPVRPLGHLFRGKFLAYLEEAFAANRLAFYGRVRQLALPIHFADFLSSLREQEWVVYAKPPFGGPQHVLQYLARCTHRVAISNGRLLELQNGRVRFRWRDSQDRNQIKETSLDAVEFIRRFLLHVLPSGFVKIRHFGFLSNRTRRVMVARCREFLPPWTAPQEMIQPYEAVCPVCQVGHLHVINARAAHRSRLMTAPHQPSRSDTS